MKIKPLSDDMLEKVAGGYGGGMCPVLGDRHVYNNNYCIYCGARDPSAPADDLIIHGDINNPGGDDAFLDFRLG